MTLFDDTCEISLLDLDMGCVEVPAIDIREVRRRVRVFDYFVVDLVQQVFNTFLLS